MKKYIILISVLLLASCMQQTCPDKECFIEKAQSCGIVSLEEQEEFGLVRYESRDCTFTKTVVKLGADEEEQLRNLIEGTSLSCGYAEGNFNIRWMYSLYAGFEECDGELKDTLEQLIVIA